MCKITLTKHNLENLLAVLAERQKRDNSVSNVIEITLTERSDVRSKGDKVRFEALSEYQECNNHFLGTAN